MKKQIRVLALAILQREDGKLLLEKGEDTIKKEIFYRPLGGGVEFGEKGADALQREFREEIGKPVVVESFLGTVENIFEWQGKPGHEVILFYKCRFADATDDGQDHARTDGNAGHTWWKSVADIRAEGALLHPHQIADLFISR